jgi:hypothetical protein
MDKQVVYGKLVIKSAQHGDKRVLKYINKPDPVVEGLLKMLARKFRELVRA